MNGHGLEREAAMSAAAAERKRAGLAGVLAVQAARVRARRVRRGAGLCIGGAGAIVLAAVALWPAAKPGTGPGRSPEAGPVAVELPAVPEEIAVAKYAGPVINVVRNDAAAVGRARIDDGQLRALMVEAGEPVGLMRVAGRAISERELVLAAAAAEGPVRP